MEIRVGSEGAGQQEGIEGELGHVGVARDVAVLRMVAPPSPQSPQADQRAYEGSDVEPEPQEAVLTEDLEVHAVRIEGLVEARAVVDSPDVLVPQGPEPRPREGAAHGYVPGRLERLQAPHRGHVPRLCRLLLADGAESIPETLGRERRGNDAEHENSCRESHAPGGTPNDDEKHE